MRSSPRARRCAPRGGSSWSTRSTSSGARRTGACSSSTRSTPPTRPASGRRATYAERFARGKDPEPLDKDFVRRHYTELGLPGRRASAAAARRRPRRRREALHRGVRGASRAKSFVPDVDAAAPANREEPAASKEKLMKATVLVRLEGRGARPAGRRRAPRARRSSGSRGSGACASASSSRSSSTTRDADDIAPRLSQDGRRAPRQPGHRGLRVKL